MSIDTGNMGSDETLATLHRSLTASLRVLPPEMLLAAKALHCLLVDDRSFCASATNPIEPVDIAMSAGLMPVR